MFDPRGLGLLIVIVVVCLVAFGWGAHDLVNWIHSHLTLGWK